MANTVDHTFLRDCLNAAQTFPEDKYVRLMGRLASVGLACSKGKASVELIHTNPKGLHELIDQFVNGNKNPAEVFGVNKKASDYQVFLSALVSPGERLNVKPHRSSMLWYCARYACFALGTYFFMCVLAQFSANLVISKWNATSVSMDLVRNMFHAKKQEMDVHLSAQLEQYSNLHEGVIKAIQQEKAGLIRRVNESVLFTEKRLAGLYSNVTIMDMDLRRGQSALRAMQHNLSLVSQDLSVKVWQLSHAVLMNITTLEGSLHATMRSLNNSVHQSVRDMYLNASSEIFSLRYSMLEEVASMKDSALQKVKAAEKAVFVDLDRCEQGLKKLDFTLKDMEVRVANVNQAVLQNEDTLEKLKDNQERALRQTDQIDRRYKEVEQNFLSLQGTVFNSCLFVWVLFSVVYSTWMVLMPVMFGKHFVLVDNESKHQIDRNGRVVVVQDMRAREKWMILRTGIYCALLAYVAFLVYSLALNCIMAWSRTADATKEVIMSVKDSFGSIFDSLSACGDAVYNTYDSMASSIQAFFGSTGVGLSKGPNVTSPHSFHMMDY